jgi:general secretion pathway protein G
MKKLLILFVTLLIQACANQTELAKQSLEASAFDSYAFTYRGVASFPGKVVCGQYSTRRKPRDRDFKPFIYRLNTADDRPTEVDVAVFCSQDPVKSFYDITGINYTKKAIPTLLQIRDDYIVLETALANYELDNFTFPKTGQGLQGLLHPSKVNPTPVQFKEGGYLNKVPLDPWSKPYLYTGPKLSGRVKGSFEITTLGADGEKGGTDNDADVNYTQLKYLLHMELL